MQVTDITNLVIEKVAKKYNIKEDDVSWHKIAIELAYMYKEVKYSNIEIPDPFQVSLLDQIEDEDTIEMVNGCKIKIDSDSKFKNYFEEFTKITPETVRKLIPRDSVKDKIIHTSDVKSDWIDDFKSNKLVKSKNIIEKTFSKDVLNCYRVCLDYFPTHLHPKRESIVKNWYSTIDKLNRIDKVPFSEIERITKLAREDEFTSKNIFHSLTKLRKKPKGEDIYWIVKWSEKFKPKTKTVNRQSEETIKKNIDGW